MHCKGFTTGVQIFPRVSWEAKDFLDDHSLVTEEILFFHPLLLLTHQQALY